eukprot:scaffold10373_cov118-Isochrysis_galbana.AAC.16
MGSAYTGTECADILGAVYGAGGECVLSLSRLFGSRLYKETGEQERRTDTRSTHTHTQMEDTIGTGDGT